MAPPGRRKSQVASRDLGHWQDAIATLVDDHLKLQTGDAVLDVGCGRGELLRLLREAVGPQGRVVGVDYSPGMVQRARARVDYEGWRNVEVYRGDASQPAELDPAERIEFFRDVLGPLARRLPFGVWFIRTFDGVDLNHPVEAAEGRRVFELK